jgi:uncharacterized protein YdeI (YjbR/CyaY-like superfamily)
MKLGKTIYLTNRKDWRLWLTKNHDKEKEIWLVYPRKSSGKPRISYDEAVEEALCFGWIDSNVKRIDDESYAQRFSPRKSTAKWSQQNIKRLRRLVKLGKMTQAGLAAIKDVSAVLESENTDIAPDILKALKEDPKIWRNFQNFPDDYKRIRIAYIESRRKRGAEEFQRSLNYFLKRTGVNKQCVFGTRN